MIEISSKSIGLMVVMLLIGAVIGYLLATYLRGGYQAYTEAPIAGTPTITDCMKQAWQYDNPGKPFPGGWPKAPSHEAATLFCNCLKNVPVSGGNTITPN